MNRKIKSDNVAADRRKRIAKIKDRIAEQRKARADRREKAKAEAKKLAEKKQLKYGKEATP